MIGTARGIASWRSWLFAAYFLNAAASLDASQRVLVAWEASPDPRATGYVLVYGNASRNYTQSTNVNDATRTIVSGLIEGQTYYFAVYAYGAPPLRSELSREVKYDVPLPPAQVVSRMIFYNGSAWDDFDPAATTSDDAAIATDKTALLPGQTATFGNYTSYDRGLNGMIVDIANLGPGVSQDDFEFRAGNDNHPDTWASAPPPAISVERGTGLGGSDRMTLIWPDNAIQEQWLQITVRATPNTRLPSPDVFYFGSAIGDSGDSPSDALVTSLDAQRVLDQFTDDLAAVTGPLDFNRDRQINSSDVSIVLNRVASGLPPLQLIDLSGATTNPPTTPAGSPDELGVPQLPGVQLPTLPGAPRTLNTEASLQILSVTTLPDESIHISVRYTGVGSVRVWRSTSLSTPGWQELPSESFKVSRSGLCEIRMLSAEAGPCSFFKFDFTPTAR